MKPHNSTKTILVLVEGHASLLVKNFIVKSGQSHSTEC